MTAANVRASKARKPTGKCSACGGDLVERAREMLSTQVGSANGAVDSTKRSFSSPGGYICSVCGETYDQLPIVQSVPPPSKPSTYPKVGSKRRSTSPPRR